MNYTKEQVEAINCRDGNLLIIACAGSGKTEVISRRIALLVSEGIQKESIVAFTFTDRAAGELKARIRRHLDELKNNKVIDDAALGSMYVGTIHSFCLQLLKEMDSHYRNFDILDDVRQAAFVVSNYKYGLGLDRLENGRTRIETIEAFLNTLNTLHIEKINANTLKNGDLRDVLFRYKNLMKSRPYYYIDFDNIIDETISYLKNNENVRNFIQSKFKHIVVDEYQDVDSRQEELIQLLSGYGTTANVCVVGDDDQAIYGFRGANIDNILTFEKRYPKVTKIGLLDNFRSSHCVVDIANRAVRGDLSRKGHKVKGLSRRLDKDMRAYHFDEAQQKFVETMSEYGDVHRLIFNSEDEEAEYIVNEIQNLIGIEIFDRRVPRGISFRDIAILLRSIKTGSKKIISLLENRGIPYIVKGTKGLFEHVEVQIFYAAFCLLADAEFSYLDSESGNVIRLNEVQTRDFIRKGLSTLKSMGAMPTANSAVFLEWIASKKRELDISRRPKELRPRKIGRRIYPQRDLFHEMLYILDANVNSDSWPEKIMYNIGRFSSLLTQFETVHQWVTANDLWELCYFLGVWASRKTDEGGQDDAIVQNAVQILTVHQAKGLEWPVVFLPGLTSRRFPHQRRYSGQDVLLEDAEYIGRRSLEEKNPLRELRDDEERRLWYVAVTRCKKFLYLTCYEKERVKASNFLREIEHNYVCDEPMDPSAPRQMTTPKAPSNTELLPTTFSDLNYYWNCSYDYKLRKLMGFSPGVKETFGFGQQIHNLLAIIHDRAKNKLNIDPQWVEKEVESRFNLRYTTGEPLDDMKGAAKKALVRYITQFPNIDEYVFEIEKPFEFIMGDAMVSGTIDLLNKIGIDTGQLPVEVVDFKTGKVDEDTERMRLLEKQLQLYSIAVEEALGYSAERAHIHFLHANHEQVKKEVDIAIKERNTIKEKVLDTVSKIKAGVFEMDGVSKGTCKGCDYKKICVGGSRCK